MFLKALEMQGFKSFPDKTVLKFDQGMTAVVGPNGSGKSNISDAVVWVLGETSAKSLRSAKMEDVIFSGTQSRRPMGYAEVTLRLDNTDRGMAMDSDEIAVTRRYYRSGESEYRLNGKSVRLKDIRELFMDTGLGRDGYSMVGQGQIESIVAAKSTERREIFEEAAGISHFRARRNDAIRRLDQAEENLLRLRDIAGELESRLGPLEKQSEKARKFLDLSEKRKELEIGLWLHTLERSTELLRRQAEKLDITKNQYEAAVAESERVFEESQKAQENFGAFTAEIEKLQREASEAEQAARDAQADFNLLETRKKHNQEAAERLRREIKEEENSASDLDESIALAREQGEKIQAERVLLDEKLKKKDDELRQLSEKENETQAGLLEQNSKIASVESALSAYRLASTSAESTVREIKVRLNAIEEESAQRETDAAHSAEEMARLQKEIDEDKQKIQKAENALQGYQLKIKNQEQKLSEALQRVQGAESQFSSLQSRKHMLEETERNMDGYQGSTKAVVRAAAKGDLKGIRGPVSRMINTEEKYAAAIETALGAAVQNIITENETDAKQAMIFLKNTNGGRATFLPMSAIKPRELTESGLSSCRGFLAIASDIVSCDADYRDIAINLLGRTVIAGNIDDAIAIAGKYSHRFKIVTLDGQVINPGGSMTGGSAIRSSGFITRRAEIEKLSRQCQEAEAEKEKLQTEAKRLRQTVEQGRAEQEGFRVEIFHLREQIARKEGLVHAAKTAEQTAISAIQTLQEEKNQSQIRLAAFDSDSEKTTSEIARLEKENQALLQEAEKIEKKRAELLRQKEDLNGEIARYRIEEAEKLAMQNANEENLQNFLQRKLNLADKFESLKNELTALEKESEAYHGEAENCQARITENQEKKNQISAKIEETIKKREQIEKEISELRILERRKSEEKENLAAETVRLEEKTEALTKERNDTEKKLYEEYNLTRKEAQALQIHLESITDANTKLADIRRKIKALGSVNVGALDEYKEVSERYEFLSAQLQDVEDSKQELLKLIGELTTKMSEQFAERFRQIREKFSETFSLLFGGGHGELILENPSDILECGIEIKAQPPGKNVKSISLLSGGEKGLCAIALLFAILKINPAPFCIFDEVEAALDDVNVTRFASFVREMAKKTQFIVITHRRGSMEAADVLYGVTMQEHGVSKLLEMRTEEMVRKLGIEA